MPRLIPPRKSKIMEALSDLGIDPKSLSNEGFRSTTGLWAKIIVQCGDVNSLKRRRQYYDVWRYKSKKEDTGEEVLHSVQRVTISPCSSPLDLSNTKSIQTLNENDSDETVSVNSLGDRTQEVATNKSVLNDEVLHSVQSVTISPCSSPHDLFNTKSIQTLNENDSDDTVSVNSLGDRTQEVVSNMSVLNEDSEETMSAQSPCNRKGEVVLYSKIERPISTDEAVKTLQNVNENKVTLLPPVSPKSGDVYIFTSERTQDKQNWRADHIMWKNQGTRSLLTLHGCVKVRYFIVKHEGKEFRKRVYELCRQRSPYFLVHYLGDESAYVPRTHGNSIESQRPFIRTAPSVLHDIRERRQEPPEKVYLDLTNKQGDSQSHKGSHQPRDKEQVQNTIKRARLNSMLHSNDLIATYILCDYLKGFVRDMRIHPELFLLAVLPEMVDELRIMMANTEGSAPHMLHYDTTFDLGDFYVSPLLFRHNSFKECPVVPLAFLIHQTRTKKTHTEFFRVLLQLIPEINTNRFVICIDREAAIESAIWDILPNLPMVNCWNHLVQNVKFKVRDMSGEKEDAEIYTGHIRDLLESQTQHDWELKLKAHSQNWSLPFEEYFKRHLEVPIKKSARFALQELGLPHSTITNNPAGSFNSKLKRMVDWKQVRPDKMLLTLFELQTFYLNEILRGRCSLGNYHLINNNIASSLNNTTFPPDVLSMDNIVALYEDRLSIEDFEKQRELDEQATKSRQTMATLLVGERKIVLEPWTQSFIVIGWKGQKYLTTVYPKEYCTCNTISQCCHILAVRQAIGLANKKKITPYTLKKLERKAGQKPSGLKGPTKETQYLPASDSKAKTTGLSNHPSCPVNPNIQVPPTRNDAKHDASENIVTESSLLEASQSTNSDTGVIGPVYDLLESSQSSEQTSGVMDKGGHLMKVKLLWEMKPNETVVASIDHTGSFLLKLCEFQTLKPHKWLCGEAIDYYLRTMKKELDLANKIFVLDHLVTMAVVLGQRNVLKHQLLKTVRWEEFDAMIGVVNVENKHWVLVGVLRTT